MGLLFLGIDRPRQRPALYEFGLRGGHDSRFSCIGVKSRFKMGLLVYVLSVFTLQHIFYKVPDGKMDTTFEKGEKKDFR